MSRPSLKSPVAIVGMSTLLPDAAETGSFWRNVLSGRDSMREIPASHWLIEDYYDPNPSKPDKTYAKRGAFLPTVAFDSMAFGVPPNMLPSTDTAQLLALMVAKRVLDDATRGQFESMDAERVSVILGATGAQELMVEMGARLQRPVWAQGLRELGYSEEEIDAACTRIEGLYAPFVESTFPGLLGNVIAGRIANRFNLGGTNCVTDAACASSLAALSMGLQELELGQSDLVITGGVDTMNDPSMFMCFSKTPALSATGDCRPFSNDADGTMLGEGLVMFALKRLADAERDGDQVYAVIRGLGTSSDGKGLSVYAPSSKGQAKALRRAYEAAGYGPDTVELMEAHGTGTKAGDAAEFGGLRTVFDEAGRKDRQWCAIGSVKSQIGHTKSTAGAAGMAKAVLALSHKVLPPTIKIAKPNPQLEIEKTAFYLNTEARPWIRSKSHPRRASVSAFGFGGSNFHATLEEYTGPAPRAPRTWVSPTELVLLSASDGAALAQKCADEAKALTKETVLNSYARRVNAGFDAKLGARVAIVATDAEDLRKKLEQAGQKLAQKAESFSVPTGIYAGVGASAGSVAFMFPGQGSQYVGMGADLAKSFDAARGAWDAAASARFTDEAQLHDVVFALPAFDDETRNAQAAKLTATEWAQPAIGTASLALLRVLSQAGIEGQFFGGHSYGELAALHAAGALEVEDFLRTSRKRGELMRDAATQKGAMTAVAKPINEVVAALKDSGVEVGIANDNGPKQVVLSDTVEAIERAEKALEKKGIGFKRLTVATAFHSPVVAVAREPFRAFLGGVKFAAASKPVFSNVSAAAHANDADAIRTSLADQIVSRVRFTEMVENLYAAGVRTFVEVGPGSVLTNLVEQILGARAGGVAIVNLDRKGQHGLTALWTGLGRLAAAGHAVKTEALFAGYALEAERPAATPKFAMQINGANYGRPYPERKLDPSKRPPAPARPAAAAPVSAAIASAPNAKPAGTSASAPAHTNGASTTVTVSPASITTPAAAKTTMKPAETAPVAPTAAPMQRAPQPVYAAPAPVMARPVAPHALNSLADAHGALQRALSDGHSSYLRAMESSFANLCVAMGAPAAMMPAQPPAYAAPQPAPQAYAPAPQSYAYAPAPAPVAAALPAPAPVYAPAPVAAAPAPAAPAKAPVTTVLPASTPAPTVVAVARDVDGLLIEIVSEKTGYPREMLNPEMSLEGDLGVDSIKRVEILSGLREKMPELPTLAPGDVAALRTLAQIADFLRRSLPASGAPAASAPKAAPVAAAPVASAPSVDLSQAVLAIVAEKTGYPLEMLNPEMSLEGDLGIDSIKRVEILSGLRERVPNLPAMQPAQMSSLRTLGQIVEHLRAAVGGSAAAPAASAAPAPTPSAHAPSQKPAAVAAPAGVDFGAILTAVVAEKTGYPVEMLNAEMSLEGDLGIDSIKRVEILSALRERVPTLPEMKPASIASLRTLGQIVEHLQATVNGGTGPAAKSAILSAPQKRPSLTGRDAVARAAVVELGAPVVGAGVSMFAGKTPARVVVTEDKTGVREQLVELLRRAGLPVQADATVTADCDAVIFLGGLRNVGSIEESYAVSREAFAAARAAAPKMLTGGVFVTVQDTGGDFGLSGGAGERAWLAGVPGLTKTAAQEWTASNVKAIDVDRAGRTPEAIAAAIASELFEGGPEVEVGLHADGSRTTLAAIPGKAPDGPFMLKPKSVIVVSGGARGVTVATLQELAREVPLRIVLLGRTALEAEPAFLRGVEGDANIKRALLVDAKQRGAAVSPAEIGRTTEKVLATREARANIASLEALGSEVKYLALDVRDRDAVASALSEVRRTWGPIAGVVHAAGVLADKAIADKTDEQFERVFDTKVKGLRALLDATRDDKLELLVMFSSVAARAGNPGQSDYALSNELLNRVAAAERVRRNNTCTVRSFGWGPWDGGMVTPALRAHFTSRGVSLITLDGGARAFVDDLRAGPTGHTELVLGASMEGAGPVKHDPLVREFVVLPKELPFLESHRIRGRVVLPAVFAIEWFASTARTMFPALEVASCENLRVLKGVILKWHEEGERFRVVCKTMDQAGENTTVSFELLGEQNVKHYAGRVRLVPRTNARAESKHTAGTNASAHQDALATTAYARSLFHGPQFHALTSLSPASEAGISATLRGARELGWKDDQTNVIDAALIDGGVQMAVVWGHDRLGRGTLPTGIGSFRIYREGFVEGPVHTELRINAHDPLRTSSTVTWVDAAGNHIAVMENLEMHVVSDEPARQ